MYAVNNTPINVPPGSIAAWPSNVIPNGWASCDGSAYNSAANPNLHVALGSPATPVLPNLNAAYLRGTGTGGGYTGPALRTFANDKLIGHTHSINQRPHTHQYYGGTSIDTDNNGFARANDITEQRNTDGATSGITLNASGGSETRPITYVIQWIIKLG